MAWGRIVAPGGNAAELTGVEGFRARQKPPFSLDAMQLLSLPRLALLLALSAPAVLGAQSVGSPAQRDSGGPQPLPSVALPPAIDRVLRDYEREWRAGNAAALAALFTADGFVMQNGKAPVRGRAAIQAAYSGSAGGALRLRAFAFATADTVGYIVGGYGYGEGAGDIGKFTLTLRRDRGGRWLIASDMDNGNAPRRAGPSSH